jgi:chromate transporter
MTPLAAALLGAAITTYTTFLPSFLFIFAGAPYVEALRGNRALAGALAAITAAVVGVILNLALLFGSAVLWQTGTIRWKALALTVAALFALVRWHVGVLWVVLVGGIAGLLFSQIHPV